MYVLQEDKTALHYSAKHGHASVVEGLIRAEADVNAADNVSSIYNNYYVTGLRKLPSTHNNKYL